MFERDNVRIPTFGRNNIRIPGFEKRQGHNSSVWKKKVIIPMFERNQVSIFQSWEGIRSEFQCCDG